MGMLSHLFYPWGFILQGLAIVHFIRRRPDNYWIWVILFLGPLGALIYLCMEALPDVGLLGNSFKLFSRRKRIGQLEAIVHQNPSSGNYEELGDLYMDNGDFRQARAAFDHAITPRTDAPDPFYRRGVCAYASAIHKQQSQTSSAWSRASPTTTFTSPPVCWPTPTPSPAKTKKLKHSSKKQPRSPLHPRPTSTSRSFSPPKAERRSARVGPEGP